MIKKCSHDSFGHLKHKLWPKERLVVNLTIWFLTTKSWGIAPISLRAGGIQHTVRNLLTRATTFFYTSSQLEVCTQSCKPPKLQESQLWEFRDSHLGVPGQNDIWVLVPWPGTEYTIRGKVVASPKFEPWWVLWVCVCPWFVRAPKYCNYALTNLLFGLCRSVWVSEVLINLPNPISELQHTPLPPKCYEPRNAP
jgi:hypothetical protein